MSRVATIGPRGSHAWQAAQRFAGQEEVRLYAHTRELFNAFAREEVEQIVVPVYNTREGENKQSFRLFDTIRDGYWSDNLVLQANLGLGIVREQDTMADLHTLIGKRTVFNQCAEFLDTRFRDTALLGVPEVEVALAEVQAGGQGGYGVIDCVEKLEGYGLHVVEREVVSHNRTRFAVFSRTLPPASGYDATVLLTEPLEDRVGILVDLLNELTRRGISILDMRSENDIQTQKLRIYLEVEGHIQDPMVREAIRQIEQRISLRPGAVRVLGSFPRIDMRTKHIKSFGFIGTGAMSQWFADRLKNDGYTVLMSGRSTELRPEEMICQVDVVVVCVPISVTTETVRRYGGLLTNGQALILLAGESETTVAAALEVSDPSVEVMLVHNLWGPQVLTMKDKNAIVVRCARSGRFCSEFESFLYKHGAHIFHDSARKHDLLMGMGQKLPTVISVALALTLDENQVSGDDIESHSTLTSLYPILAMARVHAQNPRTYAEIMSTSGDSRKIVHDFYRNLLRVIELADQGQIGPLCRLIETNTSRFAAGFLERRMAQAKAVDEVLGQSF